MRELRRLALLTSVALAAHVAWSAPMAVPAPMPPGGLAYTTDPPVPGGYYSDLGLVPESRLNDIYFRAGIIHLSNAVAFEKKRDSAADSQARERFGQQAHDDYLRARKAFQNAIRSGDDRLSRIPSAWTNVAYIEDKLGNHEAALAAADRALKLAPRLAAARENRGEALLGLNRVAHAKEQYLDLYPGQPALAALLLAAMKQWVQDQRTSGTAASPTVEELEQWIRDREQAAK